MSTFPMSDLTDLLGSSSAPRNAPTTRSGKLGAKLSAAGKSSGNPYAMAASMAYDLGSDLFGSSGGKSHAQLKLGQVQARVGGLKRKLAMSLQGNQVKIGGRFIAPGKLDAAAAAHLGASDLLGTSNTPSTGNWLTPTVLIGGAGLLLLVARR